MSFQNRACRKAHPSLLSSPDQRLHAVPEVHQSQGLVDGSVMFDPSNFNSTNHIYVAHTYDAIPQVMERLAKITRFTYDQNCRHNWPASWPDKDQAGID